MALVINMKVLIRQPNTNEYNVLLTMSGFGLFKSKVEKITGNTNSDSLASMSNKAPEFPRILFEYSEPNKYKIYKPENASRYLFDVFFLICNSLPL